ncbi:hypothetical protein AB0J83_03715 [Actinoplanes sp. NPDC049596]|uniref:WXG100-like domain-containing protein n=1 Tax=unclassified Actinoplanes TaxID=2626549 RepID=UPI003441F0A8
MALEASDDLNRFQFWLTGEQFPSANEDRVRSLAQAYRDTAATIDSAVSLFKAAVEQIRSGVSGQSEQSFAEAMGSYTRENGLLPGTAKFAHRLGDTIDEMGTQVEYAKLMIIVILVELLIEFLFAMAAAWLFPGILAQLAARLIAGRSMIMSWLIKLGVSIASAELFGMTMQVLMDLVAQEIQIQQGHRKSIDVRQVVQALEVGAFGGAVGLGVEFLGGMVGRLAREMGVALPHSEATLAELIPHAAKEAGTEALVEASWAPITGQRPDRTDVEGAAASALPSVGATFGGKRAGQSLRHLPVIGFPHLTGHHGDQHTGDTAPDDTGAGEDGELLKDGDAPLTSLGGGVAPLAVPAMTPLDHRSGDGPAPGPADDRPNNGRIAAAVDEPRAVPKVVHMVLSGSATVTDGQRVNIKGWAARATAAGWTARLWADPAAMSANPDLTELGAAVSGFDPMTMTGFDPGSTAGVPPASAATPAAMGAAILGEHGGALVSIDEAPQDDLTRQPLIMGTGPASIPSVADERSSIVTSPPTTAVPTGDLGGTAATAVTVPTAMRTPSTQADAHPAGPGPSVAEIRSVTAPRTVTTTSFDVSGAEVTAAGAAPVPAPEIVRDSYQAVHLEPPPDRPVIRLTRVDGIIAYDHRVIEAPGSVPVQDFTVKLHLRASDEAARGALDAIKQRTGDAVAATFNRDLTIGPGHRLNVTVEFTDNPADAHQTVELVDSRLPSTTQTRWSTSISEAELAHEIGHYLGLPDEYGHASNSLMTLSDPQAQTGLHPRHLDKISEVATASLPPDRGSLPAEPRPPRDIDEPGSVTRAAPPGPPPNAGAGPSRLGPPRPDQAGSGRSQGWSGPESAVPVLPAGRAEGWSGPEPPGTFSVPVPPVPPRHAPGPPSGSWSRSRMARSAVSLARRQGSTAGANSTAPGSSLRGLGNRFASTEQVNASSSDVSRSRQWRDRVGIAMNQFATRRESRVAFAPPTVHVAVTVDRSAEPLPPGVGPTAPSGTSVWRHSRIRGLLGLNSPSHPARTTDATTMAPAAPTTTPVTAPAAVRWNEVFAGLTSSDSEERAYQALAVLHGGSRPGGPAGRQSWTDRLAESLHGEFRRHDLRKLSSLPHGAVTAIRLRKDGRYHVRLVEHSDSGLLVIDPAPGLHRPIRMGWPDTEGSGQLITRANGELGYLRPATGTSPSGPAERLRGGDGRRFRLPRPSWPDAWSRPARLHQWDSGRPGRLHELRYLVDPRPDVLHVPGAGHTGAPRPRRRRGPGLTGSSWQRLRRIIPRLPQTRSPQRGETVVPLSRSVWRFISGPTRHRSAPAGFSTEHPNITLTVWTDMVTAGDDGQPHARSNRFSSVPPIHPLSGALRRVSRLLNRDSPTRETVVEIRVEGSGPDRSPADVVVDGDSSDGSEDTDEPISFRGGFDDADSSDSELGPPLGRFVVSAAALDGREPAGLEGLTRTIAGFAVDDDEAVELYVTGEDQLVTTLLDTVMPDIRSHLDAENLPPHRVAVRVLPSVTSGTGPAVTISVRRQDDTTHLEFGRSKAFANLVDAVNRVLEEQNRTASPAHIHSSFVIRTPHGDAAEVADAIASDIAAGSDDVDVTGRPDPRRQLRLFRGDPTWRASWRSWVTTNVATTMLDQLRPGSATIVTWPDGSARVVDRLDSAQPAQAFFAMYDHTGGGRRGQFRGIFSLRGSFFGTAAVPDGLLAHVIVGSTAERVTSGPTAEPAYSLGERERAYRLRERERVDEDGYPLRLDVVRLPDLLGLLPEGGRALVVRPGAEPATGEPLAVERRGGDIFPLRDDGHAPVLPLDLNDAFGGLRRGVGVLRLGNGELWSSSDTSVEPFRTGTGRPEPQPALNGGLGRPRRNRPSVGFSRNDRFAIIASEGRGRRPRNARAKPPIELQIIDGPVIDGSVIEIDPAGEHPEPTVAAVDDLARGLVDRAATRGPVEIRIGIPRTDDQGHASALRQAQTVLEALMPAVGAHLGEYPGLAPHAVSVWLTEPHQVPDTVVLTIADQPALAGAEEGPDLADRVNELLSGVNQITSPARILAMARRWPPASTVDAMDRLAHTIAGDLIAGIGEPAQQPVEGAAATRSARGPGDVFSPQRMSEHAINLFTRALPTLAPGSERPTLSTWIEQAQAVSRPDGQAADCLPLAWAAYMVRYGRTGNHPVHDAIIRPRLNDFTEALGATFAPIPSPDDLVQRLNDEVGSAALVWERTDRSHLFWLMSGEAGVRVVDPQDPAAPEVYEYGEASNLPWSVALRAADSTVVVVDRDGRPVSSAGSRGTRSVSALLDRVIPAHPGSSNAGGHADPAVATPAPARPVPPPRTVRELTANGVHIIEPEPDSVLGGTPRTGRALDGAYAEAPRLAHHVYVGGYTARDGVSARGESGGVLPADRLINGVLPFSADDLIDDAALHPVESRRILVLDLFGPNAGQVAEEFADAIVEARLEGLPAPYGLVFREHLSSTTSAVWSVADLRTGEPGSSHESLEAALTVAQNSDHGVWPINVADEARAVIEGRLSVRPGVSMATVAQLIGRAMPVVPEYSAGFDRPSTDTMLETLHVPVAPNATALTTKEAARTWVQAQAVRPVVPPTARTIAVRLGLGLEALTRHLPPAPDRPALDVAIVRAEGGGRDNGIWVNRMRVGSEIVHAAVRLPGMPLEQLFRLTGEVAGRLTVEPGVVAGDRIRSSVDGRWYTASEMAATLTPTDIVPAVLLTRPYAEEPASFVRELSHSAVVISFHLPEESARSSGWVMFRHGVPLERFSGIRRGLRNALSALRHGDAEFAVHDGDFLQDSRSVPLVPAGAGPGERVVLVTQEHDQGGHPFLDDLSERATVISFTRHETQIRRGGDVVLRTGVPTSVLGALATARELPSALMAEEGQVDDNGWYIAPDGESFSLNRFVDTRLSADGSPAAIVFSREANSEEQTAFMSKLSAYVVVVAPVAELDSTMQLRHGWRVWSAEALFAHTEGWDGLAQALRAARAISERVHLETRDGSSDLLDLDADEYARELPPDKDVVVFFTEMDSDDTEALELIDRASQHRTIVVSVASDDDLAYRVVTAGRSTEYEELPAVSRALFQDEPDTLGPDIAEAVGQLRESPDLPANDDNVLVVRREWDDAGRSPADLVRGVIANPPDPASVIVSLMRHHPSGLLQLADRSPGPFDVEVSVPSRFVRIFESQSDGGAAAETVHFVDVAAMAAAGATLKDGVFVVPESSPVSAEGLIADILGQDGSTGDSDRAESLFRRLLPPDARPVTGPTDGAGWARPIEATFRSATAATLDQLAPEAVTLVRIGERLRLAVGRTDDRAPLILDLSAALATDPPHRESGIEALLDPTGRLAQVDLRYHPSTLLTSRPPRDHAGAPPARGPDQDPLPPYVPALSAGTVVDRIRVLDRRGTGTSDDVADLGAAPDAILRSIFEDLPGAAEMTAEEAALRVVDDYRRWRDTLREQVAAGLGDIRPDLANVTLYVDHVVRTIPRLNRFSGFTGPADPGHGVTTALVSEVVAAVAQFSDQVAQAQQWHPDVPADLLLHLTLKDSRNLRRTTEDMAAFLTSAYADWRQRTLSFIKDRALSLLFAGVDDPENVFDAALTSLVVRPDPYLVSNPRFPVFTRMNEVHRARRLERLSQLADRAGGDRPVTTEDQVDDLNSCITRLTEMFRLTHPGRQAIVAAAGSVDDAVFDGRQTAALIGGARPVEYGSWPRLETAMRTTGADMALVLVRRRRGMGHAVMASQIRGAGVVYTDLHRPSGRRVLGSEERPAIAHVGIAAVLLDERGREIRPEGRPDRSVMADTVDALLDPAADHRYGFGGPDAAYPAGPHPTAIADMTDTPPVVSMSMSQVGEMVRMLTSTLRRSVRSEPSYHPARALIDGSELVTDFYAGESAQALTYLTLLYLDVASVFATPEPQDQHEEDLWRPLIRPAVSFEQLWGSLDDTARGELSEASLLDTVADHFSDVLDLADEREEIALYIEGALGPETVNRSAAAEFQLSTSMAGRMAAAVAGHHRDLPAIAYALDTLDAAGSRWASSRAAASLFSALASPGSGFDTALYESLHSLRHELSIRVSGDSPALPEIDAAVEEMTGQRPRPDALLDARLVLAELRNRWAAGDIRAADAGIVHELVRTLDAGAADDGPATTDLLHDMAVALRQGAGGDLRRADSRAAESLRAVESQRDWLRLSAVADVSPDRLLQLTVGTVDQAIYHGHSSWLSQESLGGFTNAHGLLRAFVGPPAAGVSRYGMVSSLLEHLMSAERTGNETDRPPAVVIGDAKRVASLLAFDGATQALTSIRQRRGEAPSSVTPTYWHFATASPSRRLDLVTTLIAHIARYRYRTHQEGLDAALPLADLAIALSVQARPDDGIRGQLEGAITAFGRARSEWAFTLDDNDTPFINALVRVLDQPAGLRRGPLIDLLMTMIDEVRDPSRHPRPSGTEEAQPRERQQWTRQARRALAGQRARLESLHAVLVNEHLDAELATGVGWAPTDEPGSPGSSTPSQDGERTPRAGGSGLSWGGQEDIHHEIEPKI